jgi:hypothetical protein
MANANEFQINRGAYGTVAFPANVAGSTSVVLSATVGPWIPTGAIITGIKYFVPGMTGLSGMSNGTINLFVGTQALGTNAAIGSAALLAGSVYNHTVASAGIGAAAYVSTGGPLIMQFASSDGNRSGIVGTIGVYVGYMIGI